MLAAFGTMEEHEGPGTVFANARLYHSHEICSSSGRRYTAT